jgi:starch synthase (maltosyl-transferring)
VLVIPNGVNYEKFANAAATDVSPMGLRPNQPIIITVGRLEEQKGIVHLLHAAVDVLKHRPECQFLIVGEGCDRNSLQALASDLRIDRSVLFAGPRSDVPGLLKAATVFVLPSLWEGMPNVVLEAMAAGLPVIATAVEGSREIIVHGDNGLLVSTANPSELAMAILRVLNEPKLASLLGAAAQHSVAKYFTERNAIAAYDQLYRQLLAGR